jgi:ABC-2 type transport system ATP-binding protein
VAQDDRAAESAVVISDLLVRHGRRQPFELCVDGLTIRRGQMYAVVGANGAGKTTLLSVLAGEVAPDSGRVVYHLRRGPGEPAEEATWNSERAGVERLLERVAFVPPAPPRWALRLREQLELDAALGGLRGEAAAQWAQVWLERLGLLAQATMKWSEMSTGFRMRAAIARALMVRLEVLVLDEPIGPLDAATQRRVLTDLQAIAHDRDWPVTVVLSSQHLAEVEAVADEVLILAGGRVVGPASESAEIAGAVFDVVCTLDAERLSQLVAGSWVDDRGAFGVRVHLPTPLPARQWLTHLLATGADVRSFRDVTNSSLRTIDEYPGVDA